MEEGEIYIAGMSCRAPLSDNIEEYWENLQNGIDMSSLSEPRWPEGIYGLPERLGLVNNITKFDAEYFGVTEEQANNMDPQIRILLEVAAEAIFDSGIPLSEFSKKTTGIYTTVLKSETASLGHNFEDCSTAMHAAKLAQFLNVTGPTLCVDTACSSALVAVHLATVDLFLKKTEMAIVTASSLLLSPNQSLQNLKLGMLSAEGQCFVWDERADGYLRSEGVYAVVLVAGKDYPRIYAQVLNSATNCDGFKSEGVTFPSREVQVQLFRDVYTTVSINDVAYLECHATGTQAGDPAEMGAICDFMKESGCDGSILIGSCKSNIGHGEWAAGLASLIKAVLCLYHRKIAPNRNLENLNPKIEGFGEGKLIPVTELTQLPDGLVGVSAMGFGGSNCHVVLKSFTPAKSPTFTPKRLLIIAASRNMEGALYQEELINHDVLDWHQLAHLSSSFAKSLNSSIFKYRHAWILSDKLNPVKPFSYDMSKISHQSPPTLWLIIHDVAMSYENDTSNIYDNSVMLKWMTMFGLTSNNVSGDFALHPLPMKTVCVMTVVEMLRQSGIDISGVFACGLSDLIAGYVDGCVDERTIIFLMTAISMELNSIELPGKQVAYEVYSESSILNKMFWNMHVICDYTFNCVCVSIPISEEPKFTSKLDELGIIYCKVNLLHNHLYTRVISKSIQTLKDSIQSWKGIKMRSRNWLNTLCTACVDSTITSAHVVRCCSCATSLLQPTAKVPANATKLHIGMTSRPKWIPDEDFYIDARDSTNLIEVLAVLYLKGFDVKLDVVNGIKISVQSGTRNMGDFIRWDHSKNWPVPNWLQFSSVNGIENTFNFECDGRLGSVIYEIWRHIDLFCETDSKTVVELRNIRKGAARFSTEKKEFSLHIFPATKNFITFDNEKVLVQGEFKRHDLTYLITKAVIHAKETQLHSKLVAGFEIQSESWCDCFSKLCDCLETKYHHVFCTNFWILSLIISSKFSPSGDKALQFTVDFMNDSCTAMGIYLKMAPISFEQFTPDLIQNSEDIPQKFEVEAMRLYKLRPENDTSVILVYAGRSDKTERQMGVVLINSEKATSIISGIPIPHEFSFLAATPVLVPFILACSLIQSFEKSPTTGNDLTVITDKCDCLLYSFLALLTSYVETKPIAITPSLNNTGDSESALEVTRRLNDAIPDSSSVVQVQVQSPTLLKSSESASPKTSTPNYSVLEVAENGISETLSYMESSTLFGCFRRLIPGRRSEILQDVVQGIFPTVTFVPMDTAAVLQVKRESPNCSFRKIVNLQSDLQYCSDILASDGNLIHMGGSNPSSFGGISISGAITVLHPFYSLTKMVDLLKSQDYQSQMWSLLNRIKPLLSFGHEDNQVYEASPTITLPQPMSLNIIQEQLQKSLTATSVDNPVILNNLTWLEKIFHGECDSKTNAPLFHLSISPINLQRQTPLPKLPHLSPSIGQDEDSNSTKDSNSPKDWREREQLDMMEKVNEIGLFPSIVMTSPVLVKMNKVDSGPPVFLIHPITGVLDTLQHFASNFPLPCFGLQQSEFTPTDSLVSLARFYLQCCLEEIDEEESLILMGYSFGSIVAFAMAIEVQSMAIKKKFRLILLDGSPHYVKMPLDSIRDACNHENLQTLMDMAVLVAFLRIYGNVDVNINVEGRLIAAANLDERVNIAVDYLADFDRPGGSAVKKTFLNVRRTKMAMTFLRNMRLVDEWKYPEINFLGDVALFRIKDIPDHCPALSVDYGLRNLVTGDITVKVYNTTHEGLVGFENTPQLIGDLMDVLL